MEFEHSEKVRGLQARVEAFMAEEIYPNEEALFAQVDEGDRWQPVPLLDDLKAKARAQGLWNLFLPESQYGAGLTNLEYAPLCEIMGRSPWEAQAFAMADAVSLERSRDARDRAADRTRHGMPIILHPEDFRS